VPLGSKAMCRCQVIIQTIRSGFKACRAAGADHAKRCCAGYNARHKSVARFFAVVTLLLTLAGGATAAIINEPMTNAAAPGWVMGGSAYLTASTAVDPAGGGWLRLTEPATNQAGFAMLDSSFDISQGVVIQFDYATWGGNGADGYSIYLFDGSYDALTFGVGASGGSLGYDKKTVAPIHAGLTGGYIGVGIDEYGNFSNPTEGRSGGPGLRANSVAVRGPFNHPTAPYTYLGGTAANVGTLWFNQAYRPVQSGSGYRKVVIYLTPVAAPNYMRVDVYLQFGYNQPLTQVLTGLNTGVQIPTTVKVGYGASTGGSTNYHEIRNLTVDPLPTDINLGITTTASTPSVSPGGTLTYTVSVRNYGPTLTTASNVPVIDSMPPQLTGVTWTCAGSNGGSCGVASGSGSLATTATLPFNGAATYTITGTVDPATPPGTVISNSSSLSAPAGITDYSPADDTATAITTVSSGTITLSGTVYNDSGTGGGVAHNGIRDGSEAGVSAGLTYYAKIFRSADLSTTVATPVQVSAATGAYSFSGIPAYGSYTVILSTTATANLYDPGFPSANWISASPPNLALPNVPASGANLNGQDFFLYNGSRITGKVIRDDGFNGSVSNAYDGILNGAEAGLAGVTVTLTNDADLPNITHDTSVSDANGNFTLFTNVASATLRIYETSPAGYTSVSFNPGTTAGTYAITSDYLRFAYTLYTDYSGVIFGEIPQAALSFTPATQSAGGIPPAPFYHAHTFTSTARGTVSFAASSRTQAGWPAVAYVRDSNCNGSFDAGEPDIGAAINVAPGQNICILARVTIPDGSVVGSSDQLVTRASFTAGLGTAQTADVTDTTSVVNYPNLTTSTKNWTDQSGGGQFPGDVLQYAVTLKESNGAPISTVSVSDTIDTASLIWGGVTGCPAGATCSYSAGVLSVTGVNLAANGSASVVYSVTINGAVAAGTTISNTAVISPPGYSSIQAAAPVVTVSGPLPASAGIKQLYFGAPVAGLSQTLSRTPQTSGATSVTLPRGNTTAYDYTWTTATTTTKAITLGTVNNNVILQMSVDSPTRTMNLVLTLAYSANSAGPWTTIGSSAPSVSIATAPGSPLSYSLPVTLTGTTIPVSSYIRLTIRNSGNASTTRNVYVYPYNSAGTIGSTSRLELNSQTVINIDSLGIYSAPFNGGSPVATAPVGSTVYIRAQVSDPFDYPDISNAVLTLKDPSDNSMTPSATAVYTPLTTPAAPGGTKVYEFTYPVPLAGQQGNWPVNVTAYEGSEAVVTHSANTTLAVVTPPGLALTIVGSGSVHGTSTLGQNYACGGGSCPATPFAYGDTVTLTATGSNSTFSAWSGDFTGSGNPVSFSMDRNRAVTATFNPDPARVMIDGDLTPYYAIGTALAVPDGATTIRAQGTPDFIESVIMSNPVPLLLKCGYTDTAFTVQSGYSTVNGPFKVRAGKLTVERLKVKP
jgi:uncharacterized repeat protein (TIGR01451 family)